MGLTVTAAGIAKLKRVKKAGKAIFAYKRLNYSDYGSYNPTTQEWTKAYITPFRRFLVRSQRSMIKALHSQRLLTLSMRRLKVCSIDHSQIV